MLKVLGFALLCGAAFAAPTSLPGEPDDCIKECINGVLQYGEELSILKNPNLSKYFQKLDQSCGVISTARQCVDKCGAASNPFAIESLNIVCQPEAAEQIAVIKQCLHYIDHDIDESCGKECAESNVVDETDVTPKEENPLFKKAEAGCVAFKCMSRCSVEVVAKECGKEIGHEIQGLLQHVLDIQRRDLEKTNLLEAMKKTNPAECSYLYDPSVLFGTKDEDARESADPTEDAKTLYAQAQLQLLLKQIELTEKQDHLVDRENAKLDMEMAYMAHKAQKRDQRFFAQHAVPIWAPTKDDTGKMMLPEPSQPIGENHQEPMQAQPEASEPNHPEEPGPVEPLPADSHPQSEEPQQPVPEEPHQSMPMEHSPESHHGTSEQAHPPMPMGHPPMPVMEFIPLEALPHHQGPPHMPPGFPIPSEGMPMESLPMEFVPVPMHMPREAPMPRFF